MTIALGVKNKVQLVLDRDWAGILKNGEHIPLIILGRRPKTADWEFASYKVTVEWGRRLIQGWQVKHARVSSSWYIKNANVIIQFLQINILINLEFIMFYIIKILRTKSNQFINKYLFYFNLLVMVQSWWNIYILLHINILNFEVSLSKNLLTIRYCFFPNNFRRSRLYVYN